LAAEIRVIPVKNISLLKSSQTYQTTVMFFFYNWHVFNSVCRFIQMLFKVEFYIHKRFKSICYS